MNEEDFTDQYEEEYKRNPEHAIARRVKANQLQRNVRRSQIKLNRLRMLVRLILIAFLIYGGYRLYHCKMWYVSEYAFNSIENKSLKIVGNKITPSYKILNELRKVGVEHTPIFRMDTKELSENVKNLKPIKNVYIRRFWWPARFVIMIDERIPILTIAPSEDVVPIAFFAQGGVLIGRDYMPLNPSFKTYLVLTYGTHGDDYRNWDEKKVSMIEKLARIVESNSGEKITYLDFRNPKDIYIKIQTTTLRLGELNSTALKRVSTIRPIIEQVKKMDKPVKYIDLRWEQAYYIKLDEK